MMRESERLMHYDRERLLALVKQDALQFGDFTLASGKKSNFYIDCRNVTLSAEGAALIGAGLFDLFERESIDAVGGLTMGADPVLSAVLTVAGIRGRPLRGFIVRKEGKQHGAGKLVEGPIRSGDRVAVVEDVTTTGGSALQAVAAVEAIGAKTVCVATVLDRLAGAKEAFAEKGIPFLSLLTLSDLGISP
jgi:orotate phosphoribosyltransferase